MFRSMPHAPAYPPTASDWRRHRKIITEMYIERAMSLKEVHREMMARYRFKASPRMYKARFKQWGLHKNNCASFKLARRSHSEEVPLIVPLDIENGDIYTILKNTKTYIEMALQQQILSSGATSSSQSREEPNSFRSFGGSITEGPASEDIWDTFHYGLTLLRMHKVVDAIQFFNRASDAAQAVLGTPRTDMLEKLLMVLGTSQWKGFERYQQCILDRIAVLASKIFGPDQPAAIILQQLCRSDCLERAAEAILRCAHDIIQEKLGSGHREVLRFKKGISVILRRKKDYQGSKMFLQSAILDSEKHNGYHAEETRCCLNGLVNIYMHQKHYKEAYDVCTEILTRGFESARAKGEDLDETTIRTLQNLSYLTEMDNNQYASNEWARNEENAALSRWGPVKIRDMLRQAGYARKVEAYSDMACARMLLDLCEPIWSGAGRMPNKAVFLGKH